MFYSFYFYFKHDLSNFLLKKVYKFMFKYLGMNFLKLF
jgi:hypothetical protein